MPDLKNRQFSIGGFLLNISYGSRMVLPLPFHLFERETTGDMPVRIEAQECADLNNLQRVDGVWRISRHRPYLYLPKVLAYEGFDQGELFLLLHSCFLVDRDGGGHLFLARSGTGKSTLARKMCGLMTGGNDETNLLYRRNGVLFVSSTPFYTISKLKQAVISNITAPLRQTYLLHKSTDGSSRVEGPVDPDALWRYLIEGQVSTPYTRKECFASYHRMMNDLCNTVPVRPFFHNLTDTPEQIDSTLQHS